MCLLTFFRPGAMPDEDALHNGMLFNDDGHGYAIVTTGRIVVRHSFAGQELIERFVTERKQFPDGPALFHSRFGTHGKTDKANCHPFTVGRDMRTVVAHNGIFSFVWQPKTNDTRSDTAIVAEEFLPEWLARNSLDSRRRRRSLGKWMGPGNKVVFLTVDPRFRQNAYLINSSQGYWEGDIWYSNTGYRPYFSTKAYSSLSGPWPRVLTAEPATATRTDDDDRAELDAWLYSRRGNTNDQLNGADCMICFAKRTVSRDTQICEYCLSCQDCMESSEDCFCYVPATLDRASAAATAESEARRAILG